MDVQSEFGNQEFSCMPWGSTCSHHRDAWGIGSCHGHMQSPWVWGGSCRRGVPPTLCSHHVEKGGPCRQWGSTHIMQSPRGEGWTVPAVGFGSGVPHIMQSPRGEGWTVPAVGFHPHYAVTTWRRVDRAGSGVPHAVTVEIDRVGWCHGGST